ncbi:MAG: DoxX family protein [Flavobacteriaceae bacterium]|nr:DoxX family protein [Flavobacteriaceae bacterium]
MMKKYYVLGLRFTIAISYLSAVADRLGFWSKEVSAWGNWDSFVSYTKLLNPFLNDFLVVFTAYTVTILEVVLAIALIIGIKTSLASKVSGFLLITFALAMSISTGIKGVLDYSVLTAAAGSFALAELSKK